jgi:hypothetical protein
MSGRSADLLCRDCGSRRCACCRPDPRQPASAPGPRWRGRAATLVNADPAPGLDEQRAPHRWRRHYRSLTRMQEPRRRMVAGTRRLGLEAQKIVESMGGVDAATRESNPAVHLDRVIGNVVAHGPDGPNESFNDASSGSQRADRQHRHGVGPPRRPMARFTSRGGGRLEAMAANWGTPSPLARS